MQENCIKILYNVVKYTFVCEAYMELSKKRMRENHFCILCHTVAGRALV